MATPKTPRKRVAKTSQDITETTSVDLTKAEDAMVVEDGQAADAPKVAEPEVEANQKTPEPPNEPEVQAEPVLNAEPSPPVSDHAPDEATLLDEPTVEPEVAAPTVDPVQEPSAAEQPAEKQSVPEHPAAAPTVVKSGPGFGPLVLGGVIAAGLGFGLAQVVPQGWPMASVSPLQGQLAQQADEIKALRAELQALPQDDAQIVLDEIAAVREAANAALATAEEARLAAAALPEAAPSADLTALQERMTALETRPATGGAVDPAVLSGLTAEIDTLRTGLADQKAAAEQLVAEAEAVRADAAAKAQTVLLKAALTKVEAAMQNGASFAEPLAELTDAGVTVPAILSENAENGVPTVAALMASFDEPARAALETSLRGNMGSTWSDRVGSFLRAQTGARSLTPQEGNDPDAILSRANAAVATGDIPTALTEIATLPEPAQEALAAWVAQAKLRSDAQAATVELATALSER
jgi:hypothetical protein